MHRSRTALLALTLISLTACGAQSSSTHNTVAALGAGATTSAAPTTSAATTTSAAPTTTAAAPKSAAPSSVAVTSAGPAATSPATTTPAVTSPATRTPQATADPTVSADPSPSSARPHFATPEAAMRYLAAAWNANDMTSLKHVTQGTARLLLLGMHNEAVNLRLDHCDLRVGGRGDYLCHFVHDYPASYPTKLRQGTHGTSEFIAAPSSSVGWYMFAYEGCG